VTQESRSSRKSTSQRIRSVALSILVTLILVEAFLQVAALAVWLRYRPDAADAPLAGERSVLCLGDSFTFGLGASSTEHSYPAALEGALRKDDPLWRVINGGWPGANSREVLSALDQHLVKTRPAAVYVLVGINDTWSRPDRADAGIPGGDATRFRWRWRTARLAALAARAGRN
jgi:lysophospholipase L1-like esterase